jgi:CBS domain-containing protein
MRPAETLLSVVPSALVFDTLRKMGAADLQVLPVVDGFVLVGMLFNQDVARWIALQRPVLRSGGARARHV